VQFAWLSVRSFSISASSSSWNGAHGADPSGMRCAWELAHFARPSSCTTSPHLRMLLKRVQRRGRENPLSEGEVRSDKGSVNLAHRDPFNADRPPKFRIQWEF